MTARVLDFKAAPEHQSSFAAARVGTVVALDLDGAPLVQFPGCEGSVRARLACGASYQQLERAAESRQPVTLVFENADPCQPIIIGLIAAPEHAPLERAPLVIEADADGERVRLVAKQEIVFQCGESSVTLTRSGRVIIKGTHVETHASKTNRIKGGQVRIN